VATVYLHLQDRQSHTSNDHPQEKKDIFNFPQFFFLDEKK